jgi:fatty-acyl-CoA synthase
MALKLPYPGPNPLPRAHHFHWPQRLPFGMGLPSTTLWDNLAVNARRYPHKSAVHFMGTAWSYAELMHRAECLAAWLAAHGVRSGDRVLLIMQNCPQWLMAHFAILRANAVVVPVNPMNRSLELSHYIADADARVAITSADLAEGLAQASDGLPLDQGLLHMLITQHTDGFDPQMTPPGDMPQAWREWLLTPHAMPSFKSGQTHRWEDALACSEKAPDHTAQATDMAVLPYTSGTTGLPKGCIHLHQSLMHNAMASAFWSQGTPDNVSLCVVPMFHITGMVSVMHSAIYLGATLVLMPRWNRDLAARLIQRHRVTHWTNIPTMVIDLLGSPDVDQYDLSSLVHIGGGGAAMPQAVAQRLQSQWGLKYIEGYGLTETSAPSHSNPPDRPKQQCLGVPFVSTDARVVDPERLTELPVGDSGEIVIHGPQVFQGYWKRPDETAKVFFELDGKRFFRSGDLGRVDEEGYFFITDRLKRMINASGFKVWPAEVEALMFQHPAVLEACIIATRDAYRGESVKAVVVLRPGQQGQVTEQDVVSWCRNHMAVYKAPKVVEFMEALPKSASGKVLWRSLQEAEFARTSAAH